MRFLVLISMLFLCTKCEEIRIPVDSTPYATIYLQPYDYSYEETLNLKTVFEEHLEQMLYGTFEVKVLPEKHLTSEYLGDTKTKYRIDKIIDSLSKNATSHNIYIGITHKDICRDFKYGVVDWGVLGSSISSYHACVVSDKRLRNKQRDLWKLVIHEFIHTYYEYPHCPKDNPKCIMRDAKGHADFSNKVSLCEYCSNELGSI